MAEKARSDRPPTEDQPDSANPDSPPSIPDGGLGQTMPDWLRRPPAWRHVQRQRVAMPVSTRELAPAEQTNEDEATTTGDLSRSDTSTIDPATLVRVEDLPGWLQRLAERPLRPRQPVTAASFPERSRSTGKAGGVASVGTTASSTLLGERDAEPESDLASREGVETAEPRSPSPEERVYAFVPESGTPTPGNSNQPATSFSGIDFMVVLLGIALIIALGIILLFVVGTL